MTNPQTDTMTNPSVIRLEQPAQDWNEALPLGNGRLGAMVFGDVRHERLQLNEDTLWSGGPAPPADPDKSERLAEIRRLVFAGQYAEATAACYGLQGPFTQSYLPLGDLWLDLEHGNADVEEYRRELDLDTATVTISYRVGGVTYRRSLFVSAPDQALVVRLTADQPGSLTLAACLSSPLRSTSETVGADTLRLSGRAPAHVEPDYRDVTPAIVYDDVEGGRGMRFAALLRAVVERAGTVEAGGATSLSIAGEALALGDADDVDNLTDLEAGNVERLGGRLFLLVDDELAHEFLRRGTGLLEVAQLGLGHAVFLLVERADLDRLVTVVFDRLDLQNRVRFSQDHGHGRDDPRVVVHARHPYLLS